MRGITRRERALALTLIIGGGVALGAYAAGAVAALTEAGQRCDRIAGSSIGAVTAALIAGGPPEGAASRLCAFWSAVATTRTAPVLEPWRELWNWASALGSRVAGSGMFVPRTPFDLTSEVPSLYSSAPLAALLARLVDFDALNDGTTQVSVVATDLESGLPVTFDTARGDRIGVEHILASSGMPPEFAPVRIGDRMLGDGGLSLNVPVELLLAGRAPAQAVVIDLFARDGTIPRTLIAGLERRTDLLFASPTWRALALIEQLASVRGAQEGTQVVVLSYRAPLHEAGSEKLFDYARPTLAERWAAGAQDAAAALELLAEPVPGFSVTAVRRADTAGVRQGVGTGPGA